MSEPANHPGPDAGTVARLASQRGHYKTQARTAAQERDAAKKEAEDLRKELEAAKKGDQSGRVKELEAELRTVRHRRVFDRLARERGASDDVLDDLFSVLKYQADSDEPDDGKIGKLLDEAREHPGRSRFFDAKEEAEAEGDDRADERPAAARKPAPDAGRGARPRPDGTVTLTRAQLADPKFMLDPRNRAKIAGAKIKI